MRCLNRNGGSGEETFSQVFTLQKSACNGNYATVGCDDFEFQWDQGCYGVNGRGYSLSTSDHDTDPWGGGNCAQGGNSIWPTESGGWGWHKSCGCGGIYNYNGQPMCMGATEVPTGSCTNIGCGYHNNMAERVEMWLMVT